MLNIPVVTVHKDPDGTTGWISGTCNLRENKFYYRNPNVFVVWEWKKWTDARFYEYARKRRIVERMRQCQT